MYDKACRKCGYTWRQFAHSGLLGCPYCYSEFERELMPTLKKLQKSTEHKGSGPKISGEEKQLRAEYTRLMTEKELAGLSGDFSRMVEITKDLNALAEELKERGIL